MLDIVDQILTYLRGLWRQRWYALLIAWAVCLGGWLVVMNVPEKYPAETTVNVDTDTILNPLMGNLIVGTDTESRVRMISQTLLSRPNLKQVARMTDLDLRADSASELERLLEEMKGHVRVQSAGGANLFTITYSDHDPAQAKAVVQALLNLFVERSIRRTRDDSEGAEEFLRDKIRETEEQLRIAEQRLANFKRQHLGTMPSDGRTYYQRLETFRAELEQAQLQLAEAEQLKSEYERQLLGLRPTFGVFTSVDLSVGQPVEPPPEVSGEQDSAPAVGFGTTGSAALQQQLERLLTQYTPSHPAVINTRRLLLEAREREARAQAAAPAPVPEIEPDLPLDLAGPPEQTEEQNPVYQNSKIALNEARAQVAALKQRVETYQSRVEELERKLSIVPGIEAELIDLNRDYRVKAEIHQELLERLQSAVLSQDAEKTAGKVTFQVVEPPHVSSKPDGIEPVVLLTLVLAIGLVVALGFALFLSQIFLTFDSRKQLMRATRIPVFGTVSLVLSPREQVGRWSSLLLYLALVAGLLVVYALLVQSHTTATLAGG